MRLSDSLHRITAPLQKSGFLAEVNTLKRRSSILKRKITFRNPLLRKAANRTVMVHYQSIKDRSIRLSSKTVFMCSLINREVLGEQWYISRASFYLIEKLN